MQSKLEPIYANVPTIGSLQNVGTPDNHLLPRHRWYVFKEAFSPQVVQLAIADRDPRDQIRLVDPFSGSGTSVLSATLGGHVGTGFEVNPFFTFVANTKLVNCQSQTVDRYLSRTLSGIRDGALSALENFSTFSEGGQAKKWLFNRSVLRAFEGGWQASEEIPHPARQVILLALIGAAMDVCNAEKDGKCLRYRKDWMSLGFGVADFLAAFETRIADIKSDLQNYPVNEHSSRVHLGDSRREEVWASAKAGKFELCVMSPPYLNSFDYTDVYRPELFLGKFVRSQEELTALRLRTLRSHVQVRWQTPVESNFGQHFSDTLTKIKAQYRALWDTRIPLMVQAYFEDMRRLLSVLNQHLTNNAEIWVVVSTSAYAGVEIPVDLIIIDIGEQLGWQLKELSIIRYLRRISVQQWDRLSEAKDKKPHLRESLIILERRRAT